MPTWSFYYRRREFEIALKKWRENHEQIAIGMEEMRQEVIYNDPHPDPEVRLKTQLAEVRAAMAERKREQREMFEQPSE